MGCSSCPGLPEDPKAGIVAMVKAASGGRGGKRPSASIIVIGAVHASRPAASSWPRYFMVAGIASRQCSIVDALTSLAAVWCV